MVARQDEIDALEAQVEAYGEAIFKLTGMPPAAYLYPTTMPEAPQGIRLTNTGEMEEDGDD